MKELNPLVLALNDIDTRYIVEPKRKKRPIVLMIAAAAAAMTLLTGFTVSILTADTPGVNVNYENLLSYNMIDKKDLNILTKDELREMGAIERGAYDHGIYTFYFQNVLPSEILKLYNADPITLMNGNFTEEPSDVYVHGMFDTDNFEFTNLAFSYRLTHKKTGETLDITSTFSINGCQPIVSRSFDPETQEFTKEIFELNDGSKCLVDEVRNKGYDGVYGHADFSYNGAVYWIDTYSGKADINTMKQILADLGVL